MKKGTVIGISIGIGALVFLKVFQDSIPRITDPLTNIIVFMGLVVSSIIYGVSRTRKSSK